MTGRGLRATAACLGAWLCVSTVGAGAATTTTTTTTTVPRARDVVVAAFDSLSEDAPLAVVLAYDGGYSLTQIVGALAAKTLTTSGTVVVGTTTTPPANPPTLVVARTTGTAAGGPGRSVPATDADAGAVSLDDLVDQLAASATVSSALAKKAPRRLRQFANDEEIPFANGAALIAILSSIGAGYSAEQIIVDGLMDEGIAKAAWLDGIADERGGVLRPAGLPDRTTIGTEFVDDLLALGRGTKAALAPSASAASPSGSSSGAAASSAGKGKPVGNHFAFTLESTVTISGQNATGTADVTGSGDMRGGTRVLGSGTGEAIGSGTCYDGAYNVSADLNFEVSADRSGSTLTVLVESGVASKATGGSGQCARQYAENMLASLTLDYPTVTIPATRGATANATGTSAGGVVTQTITITLTAA